MHTQIVTRAKTTLLVAVLVVVGHHTPAHSQVFKDVRQFGTPELEDVHDMAADDSGNMYICGETFGDLSQQSNNGVVDGFVRKYDKDGNLVWSRAIGTNASDRATRVAVDSNGDIYVAGETNGFFAGIPAISNDVFVTKFDPAGDLIWEKHILPFGFTTNSYEFLDGIAVDGLGSVIIAGTTNGVFESGEVPNNWDVFVVKMDANDGTELWARQFGSEGEEDCNGLAADQTGNVFIVGGTFGDLEGDNMDFGTKTDSFIANYDDEGRFRWVRQTGAVGRDSFQSVIVDAIGNATVCGGASDLLGQKHYGSEDVIVGKFAPTGTTIYLNQHGTPFNEIAYDLTLDSSGDLFICGQSEGNLGDQHSGPPLTTDIFVGRVDQNGGWKYWNRMLGTTANETGTSIVSDGMGRVFVAGRTMGDLAGSSGNQDGFLAEFEQLDNNKLYVDSFEISSGAIGFGSISQLNRSDQDKMKVQRNTSPIRMEFITISPTLFPLNLKCNFESSVRSSKPVTQTIEMWDYENETWEEVDSRTARTLGDATISVGPQMDLFRFIDPVTQEIRTRVTFSKTGLVRGIQAFIDSICWDTSIN